jgi:hypothetical protein
MFASGGYTQRDADDKPSMFRQDCGKNWREDGYVLRYKICAVRDALRVVEDIEFELSAIAEMEAQQ